MDEKMVLKIRINYKRLVIFCLMVFMLFMTIRAAVSYNDTSGNIQGLNDEEFKAAVSLCSQRGGSLYRISGAIYCGVNDQYVELEQVFTRPATVRMLGSEMYDIGSMISPGYPALGWILFFTLIITIYFFIREEIKASRRRDEIRVEHEVQSSIYNDSRNNDKRKWRPDGGYY